ncbi:MAG: hypothetical protein WBK77_03090 [Alphaproteobacteria bacterium]
MMTSKLRALTSALIPLFLASSSPAQSDGFDNNLREITEDNLQDFVAYQDKQVSASPLSCKTFFEKHFDDNARVIISAPMKTEEEIILLPLFTPGKDSFIKACDKKIEYKPTPIDKIRIASDGQAALYQSTDLTSICFTGVALNNQGTITVQHSECFLFPESEQEIAPPDSTSYDI